MKFAVKLTLCVLVLLAFVLPLNGTLLLQQNFADNLAAAQQQNTQQQRKEKSLIESITLRTDHLGSSPARYSDSLVQAAAQTTAEMAGSHSTFAVYVNGAYSVYSNLPPALRKNDQLAAVSGGETSYLIRRVDGAQTMLLTAALNIPGRDITLLSAYDISDIFTNRDAQLHRMLLMSGATLLAAVLLVGALSLLLTRPLAKLRQNSCEIAAGNYALRTGVHTRDEVGELAESFNAMADAVQEKIETLNDAVRQREDFVCAFTHELKTPMTSMLGYAALLRAAAQPPETQREAADYIYHETKRLEALSQKLMLFMNLKPDSLRLEAVSLRAVFNSIKKTPPQKGSAVAVQFLPCHDSVLADRVLLEDLLRNLMVNAQRACSRGGSITVGCERRGDMCILFVTDTGCGIPQEEIAKLTEPFFMVDKSRARQANGSGIGLSLCSRIAALHGGTLHFESETSGSNRGTTVSLALHAAPAKEETP
ncbi:MAG: HAMP domain-containing sensor histidine kinase [Ruthenibacterium sp.]